MCPHESFEKGPKMANPFLVLGGIAVGIVTAAFGVLQVPGWVASAQDASAINDLSIIRDAQAAEASSDGKYAPTLEALAASDNGTTFVLSSEDRIELLTVDAQRSKWCGVAQSESGRYVAGSNYGVNARSYSDLQEALLSISCDWAAEAKYSPTTLAVTIDTRALGCVTPGLSFGSEDPDATIDWGDGTPLQDAGSGHNTHTYAVPGEYMVLVDGQFYEFAGSALASTRCLISVDWWGEKTSTVFAQQAFIGAINLVHVAQPPSTVTSMRAMFEGIGDRLTGISDWDTSRVTDMARMFASSSFNEDISGWNTSRVITMSQMFSMNPVFNQPIGSWDTANVAVVDSMFNSADSFNQPLGKWKMSNVTDFEHMFTFSNFNQDISSWDTRSATTMTGMFMFARSFNQDLSGWNVTGVNSFSGFATMSGMAAGSIPAKFQ